jgi:hypothetical protein
VDSSIFNENVIQHRFPKAEPHFKEADVQSIESEERAFGSLLNSFANSMSSGVWVNGIECSAKTPKSNLKDVNFHSLMVPGNGILADLDKKCSGSSPLSGMHVGGFALSVHLAADPGQNPAVSMVSRPFKF